MKTNDNQEIYIYSSQHNNNNERQLNELRKSEERSPQFLHI